MNETSRASHWLERITLFTAVAIALLTMQGCAESPVAPTETAAAATPAGPLWGHELVGRAPDPAVRFGRLPNGLRYAIQHNETPKDGVSMRMRIGSGSLQERDEEQGLAHFLEHMAFRGSAKVPDGEVVRMLQRQGLRFGADTNAFTSPEQTLYHFNFPRADAAALDTGLMLFREIAQHLLLDPQLVEQEKGVILSEERVRDVPALRVNIAQQSLAMAGTRLAQRLPIGRVDTIQAATAERLRRYYVANYRPDNATVIVVGNIDVDAVERQLRERFADWTSDGTPDVLDLGRPKPAQLAAEFVEEGAPDRLVVSWLLPPDNRPLTQAVMREHLVRQLASSAVNLRLSDRALQLGVPFIGAQSNLQVSVNKVAGQARLFVSAAPERWAEALDAAMAELRQLLERGVTAAEVQRLAAQARNQLLASVTQASTRHHATIADALVRAAQQESPYQSASQALAEAEILLRSIKADEVSYALRRDFGGSQPLLFRSAKAGAVGAEALTRQMAQALTRPLTATVTTQVTDWPYTDFGPASAIVSRMTDPELGATAVQFANGTRLMVKSTAIAKDRVQVQVRLGQGRGGMDQKHLHALWALDYSPLGGTGQRSLAEISQWQQVRGKRVDVKFNVDHWTFSLLGATRPADLTTQLQLLAAFARDPGYRPELGEKLAALAPAMAGRSETLPMAVYAREVSRVLNSGDGRLGIPPSAADVAATRADELPAVLGPALASAPDVVIVGDVSEEAAIVAVQATFGSGSERPRLSPVVLRPAPIAGGGAPHVAYHRGRADQALLGWHWTMPDQWADPALSFTGRVAAAVLRARLVDTVREKLGITYSPSTSGRGSLDVPGRGGFAAQIETPPDKFDAFRDLLRAQLRELADQPVSTDELQRAKQPLIEESLKAPETHAHWLMWLSRIQVNPLMKGQMQAETGGLQAVTALAVQAYFRDHIVPRPPIEVVSRAREAAALAK